MNYKLLSVILFFLLLASNVYFLYFKTSASYEFIDENNETVVVSRNDIQEALNFFGTIHVNDQTLLNEWENRNKNISASSGTTLSIQEAATKLKEFKRWNTQVGNLVREIKPHGYAFGKERIRKMLNKMDSINTSHGTDIIQGVRLYLTLTPRPNQSTRNHLDLLFVPIKKDGSPFYDFTSESTLTSGNPDDMLLNTSVPCPDECGASK
jgi:hypothetical protein